jgi:hypothetical protein
MIERSYGLHSRESRGCFFDPEIIICEASWSDVLGEIQKLRHRSLSLYEFPMFFSKFGDHCGRIRREVNALFPSHDLQVWSNGK